MSKKIKSHGGNIYTNIDEIGYLHINGKAPNDEELEQIIECIKKIKLKRDGEKCKDSRNT